MQAWYFDGRSSRRQEVSLSASDGMLSVVGANCQRTAPSAEVQVSEPMGRAPRTLRFNDGAFCEVPQGDELDRLLSELRHRPSRVVHWQSRWRYVALGLVVVFALLVATYRWGLPWLAERVAGWLPRSVVVQASDQVMQAFDGRILLASKVPLARRERIEAAFHRLVASDATLVGSQLVWRGAPQIGPNAFALPDGRVVLLDELVALSEDDEDVLGVLAHELGHVCQRHGLRQMIQSSVVSVVVASYLNDFSSVLSGMGTLLLQSNYSREFEREADEFGATLMWQAGYSPDGLVRMLVRLERASADQPEADEGVAGWVSSHPETQERIKRLRAWHPGT